MSGRDQVPGQEPAPAAELDDQAVGREHRLQDAQDPRRHGLGMEVEALVVHAARSGR